MIVDLHNDFLTNESKQAEKYCPEKGVYAVFRGNRSFAEIKKIVEKFLKIKRDGQFLGLEDVGYVDATTIEEILSWKPRYVSLTWNYENELAGGCLSDGQLTSRGKEAVRIFAEHKISIDCAHLNRKSFFDVLDCSVSILNSHTGIFELKNHPRNITKEQLREIAASKGVVGITLVSDFLTSNRATGSDVARHIEFAIKNAGPRSVCIGTDFCGSNHLPSDCIDYPSTETAVSDSLAKIGFLPKEIQDILQNNASRFLSKNFE